MGENMTSPRSIVHRERGKFLIVLSLCLAACTSPSVAAAQEAVAVEVTSVVGAVTLTAADGADFLAAGVRLIVTCESERFQQIAISDDEGMFRLERLPPRGCTLVTELQGFRSASAEIQAGQTRLQFHLEVEPIGTGVTITGAPTKDCGSSHADPVRPTGRKSGTKTQ
jgi:hypothetical protein